MPQRMGAGFQAQGDIPQLNPDIRPSMIFQDCCSNDEMELLASYVFGTQTYPSKFHKNNTGQTVAFPPWDRLMLAIVQFEAAGFTFGGFESAPATTWKVNPFAMVQEADRDQVDKILKDLINWNVPVLQKLYDKWDEHLEKIDFPLGNPANPDEVWTKAPLTIEEGRSLNIRSLLAMKKGDTPVGAPNKPAEVAPAITRLQGAQTKKLKGLDNDKIMAETAAKTGGKKTAVAAAVAKINKEEGAPAPGAAPDPETPAGEAPEADSPQE